MTPLAPIALFVYKRPAHTRQTLEALARNAGAEASNLHVFCDGPETAAGEEERRAIRDVRQIVSGRPWCGSVCVHESPTHKGLAASIIDGVTHMVGRHGRVIVLEDDLVTSPFFLQFMNDGLDMYQDDDRIASIVGYCYPVREKLPETFFLKGTDCWGWATWERAWALFNHDGRDLLRNLEEGGLQHEFNMDGSMDYMGMLREQVAGQNDSWAVRWHASAFLAGRLSLYPGESLVQNIGLDGTGRHCGDDDALQGRLCHRRVACREMPVQETASARAIVMGYLRARCGGQRRDGPVSRLLRKAVYALPSWRGPVRGQDSP